MRTRATARTARALLALLAAIAAACDPASGGQTDSQTNWLRTCNADADCDGLQCVCGTCTRSCETEASCAGVADAVCILAPDPGAIALCGGDKPPAPGLCLPRCEGGRCANASTCMAGVCTPTPKPTARVTVDVSTRYQTLVGFGASVGYAINAIAQHPQKAAIHKAMFTDLGMDVLRLRNRHGDVDNDLTTSREVADAAATSLGHKPIIILTSWSPPASLKANAAITCGGNPDTCTLAKRSDGSFDYAGYGAYWRASLDAYAEVGIVPDYISLQNNPNWVPTASSPGEACRFLPTEGTATVSVNGSDVTATYPGFAQAMAAVVGQLAGLASVPKIAAPDVTGILNVADYVPYLDFSHVDAISHHLYGTDPAAVDGAALAALGQLGESYQRPLFQTEMQSEGFETAVLMHDALAVEGASTYLQNDFVGAPDLSPNPTALIALAAESFTLQGPYHAMRHYSLHTDPGWVRVAATASVTNLLASAWTSPAGDAVTLVLVNVGFDPIDAQIQPGPQASMSSQVTRTVFAGVERSAELGAFSSDGILRVPGRAMVTVAWRR